MKKKYFNVFSVIFNVHLFNNSIATLFKKLFLTCQDNIKCVRPTTM